MFSIKGERIEIGRYLVKTSKAKFELSTVAVPRRAPRNIISHRSKLARETEEFHERER